MSDQRSALINYISDHFVQEDSHLKDIICQQEAAGGPMMNVGPDQGKFLYLLMKILKPRTVLEIGSYFGYSAVWLARALTKDAMLTCVESSGKQCQIIRDNLRKAGLEKVTQVIEGKGLEVMQKFEFESEIFDVIFIDADKKNYPNYFMLASKLLAKGGVLLVDNCIWYGKILDADPDEQTQAIIEFNRLLAESKDFESTLLTVQDGLCIGIRL